LEQFKEALSQHYTYSDEEMEKLFSGIDIDGTGRVHYSEFLAATIEAHGSIDEERLAEAFDRLDSDDTGYITVSNLQEFLGEGVPTSYLDEVIDEADITHDHRISYPEFLALWNDEGDQMLRNSKEKVRSRRHFSRETSIVSSISSVTSFTDSERDALGDLPGVGAKVGTGTLCFVKQKELSVRGQWV
jgi:Ca2+-binding EF-hand superfamily protein